MTQEFFLCSFKVKKVSKVNSNIFERKKNVKSKIVETKNFLAFDNISMV